MERELLHAGWVATPMGHGPAKLGILTHGSSLWILWVQAQAASSAAARGGEGGDHSGTQAAGSGSGGGKQWGAHERSKNRRSHNAHSGDVP